MKKVHIIGIVVIAIAITIIVTTASDASTYVSFKKAKELYQSGSKRKIHVVGNLKKENGEIVGIKEGKEKLSFEFQMVDEDNFVQKVIYNEPIPTDFTKSEQVVVIGSYIESDLFFASEILMKCPSKYQEEKVY